jgi:hypothetical protein
MSPSNYKAFSHPQLQPALITLLADHVKPTMSAYKHSRLTDKGTQRIRQRVLDKVSDEINPPTETISILEWVSELLEVLQFDA